MDAKAFSADVIEAVKSYVERETAPLVERLVALEARTAQPGADGIDGRDGLDGLIGEKGDPGQPGEPGKDGADGKDGVDGVNGKDGTDGKDADMDLIFAHIGTRLDDVILTVAEKAAALITPEPGPKGDSGEPGERGEKGADGKDGLGQAGSMVDREGNLTITMTDGTTRELGKVVGRDGVDGKAGADGADGRDGKDGSNGQDGTDADMEQIQRWVTENVTRSMSEIPVPRDGADGLNGRDGTDGRDGSDGKDFDPSEIQKLVGDLLIVPDDTNELVTKTMVIVGDAFEPVWQYRQEPAENGSTTPVVNVNLPAPIPKAVRKTLNVLRDANGTMIGVDSVEIPDD